MRVSVDIPERDSGLDSALAKQFAEIQKSLLALVKTTQTQHQEDRVALLKSMQTQQAGLVDAMTQLLSAVSASKNDTDDTALAEALRGLKTVITELPGDLKDALDRQYQSVQSKSMKVSVNPQVTVEMPKGLVNRLDALESSLLQGMKRSRSRTFGSNF